MAKEFSYKFYHSQAWKDCKASYIRKMDRPVRGLCEICYKEGKHTLGKELHHKIPLTPYNIHDREITLNHKNLILLCFDCHQRQHGKRKNDRQYIFDEQGNILPRT